MLGNSMITIEIEKKQIQKERGVKKTNNILVSRKRKVCNEYEKNWNCSFGKRNCCQSEAIDRMNLSLIVDDCEIERVYTVNECECC